MKSQWGLSVAALIQRAKDLDLISDRQFREFQIRLNRLGWKTVEPNSLEIEAPELLDRIVEGHLSSPRVTATELAATAMMTEGSFLVGIWRRENGRPG